MMKKCLIIIFLLGVTCAPILAAPISPQGQKLSQFLDSLDVTDKWQAHERIDWLTGEPNDSNHGAKTSHCSAFVAAAADKLGVYILRPPEHSQTLLANAQYDWLQNQGARFGWLKLPNAVLAQATANQGCIVVVARANKNNKKPGHIAIVRPDDKSDAIIAAEGPQIIQAALQNYNSISMTQGFPEKNAAKRKEIIFYWHTTPFCQIAY